MEIFARYSVTPVDSQQDAEVVVRRFLQAVYSWMCAGLTITALTAWTVSSSPRLTLAVADLGVVFWSLVVVEFVLVIVLTRQVNTMSAGVAGTLFVVYSVVTGLTLSPIFMAYTAGYVERTCLITAGCFAVLAYYGTVTRRDLGRLEQFLVMGLFGLLFASGAQLLWPADMLRFMVDFVGAIVFAGLTARDAQRLRDLALGNRNQPPALPINGALALYLDFVNLFLSLLGSEDSN